MDKDGFDGNDDYIVCTCMGVTKSEIEEAIDAGNDTLEALQEALMVGISCSSCVPDLEDLCCQRSARLGCNKKK